MKQNKFGFLTIMFFVFGSCVGTGIFFKNSEILSNTGSIIFSLIAWCLAIFAVICIAACIKEMAGNSKENVLGNIGWIKTFCQTRFYKGFRNFMIYLYMPVTIFYLPFYFVQSLMDSLSIFYGNEIVIPFWMMILISFVMVVYLTVVPMFTKKVAIFQNYLFSFLRFIPLLFGIIGGLIIFVTIRHGSLANDLISTTLPSTPTQPFSLTSVSPFLGIIASIPAIFFSFDGFYTCSSLEKDMKKPEQFSKALVCGIIVVATFYILFSIFTLLAADGGTIIGLNNAWDNNASWVKICKFIFLLCISFAVFGAMNNWGTYTVTFTQRMFERREVILFSKNPITSKNKINLIIESFLVLIFILLTTIGIFYTKLKTTNLYYDEITCRLFNFVSLISNWLSLFIFFGLGFALVGFLFKNKKCKTSTKYLAWISIFFISLSVCFEITNCFVTLISSIIWQTQHSSQSLDEFLIPNILKTLFLFSILSILFINNNKQGEYWVKTV